MKDFETVVFETVQRGRPQVWANVGYAAALPYGMSNMIVLAAEAPSRRPYHSADLIDSLTPHDVRATSRSQSSIVEGQSEYQK